MIAPKRQRRSLCFLDLCREVWDVIRKQYKHCKTYTNLRHIMDLNSSSWITIIGWPVTFVLGIAATLITQRLNAKRKRVGWTLVSESNLLSEATLHNIQTGFGVPLGITINNAPVTDIATIRIKVGNTGNSDITGITLHFRFGDDAKVYVGRYIGDLGVYRQKLSLQKHDNVSTIGVKHINRGQSFEVEFLVGNYHPGDVIVDMAEPGVDLRRLSNVHLEEGLGRFAHFSLGMFGVRYDPTATQTAHVAEEVKSLRREISNYLDRGESGH